MEVNTCANRGASAGSAGGNPVLSKKLKVKRLTKALIFEEYGIGSK